MKGLHRLIRTILVTLAVVVMCVAAGWLGAWRFGHLRGLRVQTGSMQPLLKPGDVAIVQAVPADRIRIGDVVSYASTVHQGEIVSHRVIALEDGIMTTRGDALEATDPPVPTEAVIGRVLFGIPHVGSWLDGVQSGFGLALVIYLPALAIVIGECNRLIRHYRSQRYVLAGWRPHH